MTWKQGQDDVAAALRTGDLQQVTGGQAAGDGWITDAQRKVETAQTIADIDPHTAYVTAYDAARFALVGVLAHQGLRATQRGGHVAVERAVRAQFGASFVDFGTLRRRRAELEYPSYPGVEVRSSEVVEALNSARRIIDSAIKLLPHLTIYTAP